MIKKFLSSELGKGTLILLITMNLFNLLNFIFSISMGRMLAPAEYGILMTLMSFIYLYSIPSEAIQYLASRYTSKFNIKKEQGKIKNLMKVFFKTGTFFAFIVFIVFLGGSVFLSKKLEIDYWLLIFTNLLIFAGFYGPITRGVLQGKKRFGKYGAILTVEGILKVILALILVNWGFGVFGAVNAVIVSVFLGILLSLYFCKDVFEAKEKKAVFQEIKMSPYFITMIAIMFFLSIDIILAKWFFSATIVGRYAVLSILGKIIYMGTQGISKAMFPLSSERKDQKKDSSEIFKKSFLVTLILGGIGIFIYWLFPEAIVLILYGNKYSGIGKLLFLTGASFGILALTNIILTYKLSIGKLKKSYWLFVFVIFEIILFSLMHENLSEFVKALFISNIVIFIGSYFFKE